MKALFYRAAPIVCGYCGIEQIMDSPASFVETHGTACQWLAEIGRDSGEATRGLYRRRIKAIEVKTTPIFEPEEKDED